MPKSRRPKAPTTAPRVPPQDPPLFTHKPKDLVQRAKSLLQDRVKAQRRISKDPATATFRNTIIPLAMIDQKESLEIDILFVYQNLSADPNLRRESQAAWKLIAEFRTPEDLRENLSLVIDAVVKRSEKLDQESQKLLDHFSGFYKNERRKREKDRSFQIQKRLSELYVEIHQNMMDMDLEDGMLFTSDDLDGVPSSIVDTLPKQADKLFVHFWFRPYFDVLKYASNSETRRILYLARHNCGVYAKNVPLFKEVFELRDKAAHLEGHANHAAWRMRQMAYGTTASINDILKTLRSQISSKAAKEIKKMKDMKRAHSDDTHFYPWDFPFYDRLVQEKELSLDPLKVAEYFETETTVREVLKILEEPFGLVFEKDISKKTERYWHQDVQLYHVWDSSSRGGKFVGYLYLDLYFRKDKNDSSRTIPLRPGFTDEAGNRRYPATAVILGFSKPTPTEPSLLTHYNVATIFHELGHAIHELVSQTKYAQFHGTRGAGDFVELPGLMLENWGWSRAVLGRLNKHYSGLSNDYLIHWQRKSGENLSPPREKMPKEMITKLLESRRVNSGLSKASGLGESLFDIAVHSPKSHQDIADMNISELYNRLLLEVQGFDGPPDQGHDWAKSAGSMTTLVTGYDAILYTYTISEVYAIDMFNCFFKKDPMAKAEGERYRDELLKKGGSEDEMKMLVKYLKRKPIFMPFYQELGIM